MDVSPTVEWLSMSTTRYRIFETDAGPFALITSDAGLSASWLDIDDDLPAASKLDRALLPGLSRRLKRYFAGADVDFDDVATPPGPDFRRRCWDACRSIPPGETQTYRQLASAAGSKRAFRAAGGAMRNNPLPVIVPCHRVVGARGLYGYSGSTDPDSLELSIKTKLLAMEGAL